MGVYSPHSSGTGELLPLPPFPPNDPRWDERDRFGLAVWPPSLLAESVEERCARIGTIERLASDLFKTAVTHLGRPEARRLFAEAAKAPWKKGKQPNRDRNDRLLEMFDNAVREGPARIKSIPRLLAEQLCPDNPRSVPATEKQIRRLVRDRNRRQKAMEAAYRRFPRSLLDQANSSDGDI
jgi:hypothetical protein